MKKFLNRFKFALEGIRSAFAEQTFRICCFFAVLVIILMIILGLNTKDKEILILTITIVLAFELLNSQIETLLDIVQPNFDNRVKKIKDISAGAVLISIIGAVVIGILIFYPYVLSKI